MNKPLLIAGGLAALGVVAYFAGDPSEKKKPVTTTAASSSPASAAKDFVFRWAPNTTYDYSLHYASKTKAVPIVGANAIGQQIEGGLELEGTLSIHAYSDDGDAATLGYALSNCKGSFNVAGQPAWPDCHAVFDNRELLVKVDHFGKVKSVHAPAGGATLFEYTMRAIIEETQVRLGGVAGIQSWVEAELLPQGTVESVYRVQEGTLVRTRSNYNSLRAAGMLNGAPLAQSEVAKHVIELDGSVVGKIHGTETLKATTDRRPFLDSTAEIDLEKTGEREDDRGAIDLTKFTSRSLEDLPESTSMHQRMLEQRAGGMTWESVIEQLTELGEAGKMPDHSRWAWRATALLELDPKRAFDLVSVFEHGHPGGKLRPLVLDLLASVNTPEAQEVMRQLIGSETSKKDPRALQLVQRLGFLDQPDRKTVKFINDRYATAKADKNRNERLASAYTLATVAGKADDSDKKEAVELLTKDLVQAPANETADYMRALANTDSALAFGTYQTYSTSTDPEVRAAVADALDAPQLPESLELLMTLIQDPDREVQRTAIRALRSYKLDSKVMFRLAEIANDGKILPANVRHVLDLVKTYRFVCPTEEEALLRALLAHEIDDVLVRAAAQQLLDAR